jgi:hypothetical protein
MKTRSIRNLALYFEEGEEAAAELIASASERSLDLIRDLWGLEAPDRCRVYVMTSWQSFLFQSAPWPWRLYLAVTLPLRYARIQKVWDMAGGWTQRYGRQWVVGIKPPHLLQKVNAGLRERVFIRREVGEWVQHNTCHELVHACSDRLRLPAWLHEGLAMVTVDRFAGKPTVKAETLEALTSQVHGSSPHRAASSGPDSLLYLAVRGYWITRFLADVQPQLLREQFARQQTHEALVTALASGLEMEPGEFWSQIDDLVVAHFAGISTH